MNRSRIVAVIAALTCAAGAEPALGANAGVAVGQDKTLSPTAVAVDTGQSVTWTWVGPDTDHSIVSLAGQAESWDSDPVTMEPSRAQGGTFVKTFTKPGSFGYVCRVHPDKMRGTVTVANRPPLAAFVMSSTTPISGQTVTFDASGSSDPDGATLTYRWDFENDGTLDTAPSTARTSSHVYPTPGTRTVRLQVTDAQGATAQATALVHVGAVTPPAGAAPGAAPSPGGAALAGLPTVAGRGGAPGPGRTAGAQQLAPRILGLTRQRAARRGAVVVTVACRQRCSLTARGSIAISGTGRRLRLLPVSRTVAAGGQATLSVRLGPADVARLRRALGRGQRATATVTVETRAGATARRVIALVR